MADNIKCLIERIERSVLMGLLFLALTCTVVCAQSTAQVSGTVSDKTGAVLPGVEVTVTQTDTGLTRSAVTNEAGSYTMPNLPVGPYKLEASLPGFSTFAQTGIVLTVGANAVINVSLSVGQVSQTVEVQADAALVETRSTGVGQMIDNVRVLELPLNGRNVQELIVLSGAAVGGGNQFSNRNYPTDAISVGGGMSNGLTYLLDGGVHNDPTNNLNLPLPFPDALQEFKVETSALPAQYGYHSAGAVNAVTKSGTNQFHGSLFEFVRNKVFNARNAFALTRDGLKRNQFGGVLGGPVVKNKLFFFGGYQDTTLRSEPTDVFQYVPTPAMLAGDWTAITSPACNTGRQIILRPPFVNNRIDPALLSKPALALAKRLPTPTGPCGEVRFGRRVITDESVIVVKVDYQRSQKHSLFGRYYVASQPSPHDYDGVNPLTLTKDKLTQRIYSFVFGDTYLIGTGTVSSFRATVNRARIEKIYPTNLYSYGDLGVKDVHIYPEVAKMVRLNVPGAFRSISAPTPGVSNSTLFQLAEDVSWVRGAHQIGFGLNYLPDTRLNVTSTLNAQGAFSFTAQQTGLGLGDFMLGKPADWSQALPGSAYFRRNSVGLYLQDTWKANSRLTVNAGVRWEPSLPITEKRRKTLFFDRAAFERSIRSTVYKNAPAGLSFSGDAGVRNNSLYAASRLKFAPRLGLAWDPNGDGRTVIRTAYGIYFDFPNLYSFTILINEPPWGYTLRIPNPPGGFENPWQGYPGGNPFPVVLNSNIPFPVSGAYLDIPRNVKTSYVNQWNLSIQRQIGTDWLVAGNYLGNSTIHLWNGIENNPAVYLPGSSCVIAGQTYSPCSSRANTAQRRVLSLANPDQGQYYGTMTGVDDGGTRSYNALLLSVQRRRSKGITVQGNYTWSHCIDDGVNFTFVNNGRPPGRRGFDRGNCEIDRRHNFNLSIVYETPQFSSRALRALGTGWQISGIVGILSGRYLLVTSGIDNALDGTIVDPSYGEGGQRPNQVLPDPYAPNKNTVLWLNPAAFAQPALGTYGNLGVRNIPGPGSIRINMGLTRKFHVRENHSIEFRAEAFNLPNHLNPDDPVTTLSAPNFGRIQSAADPRIIQLALKYVF